MHTRIQIYPINIMQSEKKIHKMNIVLFHLYDVLRHKNH